MKARKVIVYRDEKREWRYRAIAFNQKTIDSSEEGFTHRSHVLERVEQRWPGVEVVIDE